LCALFSGFACGIKYTAFINVFIVTLLILFSERFHNNIKDILPPAESDTDNTDLTQIEVSRHNSTAARFISAGKYLLLILLVFSPWMAKNLIFAHNPISPWGTSIFNDKLITAAGANSYFNHINGHGVKIEGLYDIISLPWQVTFKGYRFGGGFDILGPVFLLFLPVLFLKFKLDKIDKILLIYSVIFVVLWIFTGKVLRFLMPAIPFLCAICARGTASVFSEDSRGYIKYTAYTLLAAALVHNLLMFHWVMATVDPYSVVFGKVTDRQYLAGKLNYFNAVDSKINKLPIGSKTIYLGETRGYYANTDTIVPTDFNSNPLIEYANSSDSPDELLQLLRQSGITHIFVNYIEFERLSVRYRFTDKGFLNYQQMINYSCKTVFEDRHTKLYALFH
jgi:hypothetical protein